MKVSIVLAICIASAWANPALQIIGGHDAKEGQYPYQVSVQGCITGICQHGCGGTILNKRWVLTAARCIKPYPATFYTYRVLVGSLSMYIPDQNAEVIKVDNHIVHPQYNTTLTVSPFDIALLHLEKDIEFNNFVQPAKLPSVGSQPSGEAVLTGWGTIANPPNPYTPPIKPLKLQTVNVTIVKLQECEDALKSFVNNTIYKVDNKYNVCTGPLTKEISICAGDSGGPLSQNGTVVGVVSWGVSPCGQLGAPSVYVRTGVFVDWINSLIAKF